MEENTFLESTDAPNWIPLYLLMLLWEISLLMGLAHWPETVN